MKISYKSVKDILTPKEMKNVLGGSDGFCLSSELRGTGYTRYHWIPDNGSCFDFGNQNCISSFLCGPCDMINC